MKPPERPTLKSKAFDTKAKARPPLTIALAVILVLWILVAVAQGASPASEVRYGPASWPFTLLFASGLALCLYAIWRRKRWLPWLLGASLAFDVAFALIRGEFSAIAAVIAVALIGLSLGARSEWS